MSQVQSLFYQLFVLFEKFKLFVFIFNYFKFFILKFLSPQLDYINLILVQKYDPKKPIQR